MWGDNRQGRLGMGASERCDTVYQLGYINENIKNIRTRNGVNYIITSEGSLYRWPAAKASIERKQHPSAFKGCLVPFPTNMKLKNVDVGTDFVICLETHGLVFSFGANTCGELGLGDFKERSDPTLISFLREQNEVIQQVSCGNKHVIVQSAVGRIYTWGLNSNNQLDPGEEKMIAKPIRYVIPEYTSLRCKPRNV